MNDEQWLQEIEEKADALEKAHGQMEIIEATHDFSRIASPQNILRLVAMVRQIEPALARAEADKAELVEALEQLLMAYEMILPGVAKISIPDYGLMNNAPCKASAALSRVKESDHDWH